MVLLQTVTLVGKDKSGVVDGIASHHTAYGIADELLHHHVSIPLQFALLNLNLSLLQDGDFIQWNIRGQFILQTIDVNELAVQFLFILMELHEETFPLCAIGVITPFHTLWPWCSRFNTDMLSCLFVMLLYYIIKVIEQNLFVHR